MSTFDPDADLHDDLAFRMLVNSPVTLFWRRSTLERTVRWLDTNDYHLVTLDASRWAGEDDLHGAVAAALDFPDHYGRNLDALNDCMRDVVAQEYGWPPEATGLVVVLNGYDTFAALCPRSAQIVLDILADQARRALLFGRRLIVLVRSDDPQIRFEPVGASPVVWNHAEWLTASRRPR